MIKQKKALLLFAYAILVNGYIHTEQLRFLNRIIGKDMHEKAYEKMLCDNLTAAQSEIQELIKLLRNESKITIRCFRKKLVKLMCYDGEYDEREKKFVKDIFPEYEPKEIFIRWNIFRFRRRVYGTFASRLFSILLAKLFHEELPYFKYFSNKADKICMGVDEITQEAIRSALELSKQYRFQDLNIDERIDEIRNDFDTNRQMLNDTEPTIALVGRTKAGKSTLFSLLSSVGDEFIGKGSQRTTKYITATHYHGIKVIDTPGLNAASKYGREDERKTMNACRAADDILFVMSDDTYNEELDFFKQIVTANKPITILFNHKNDVFEFEYKWEEYRKNPDSWKNHEGEKRMEGWENRIKQFAGENGYEHVLTGRIYHTFLLAARFAMKKGKTLPKRLKNRKASRSEWEKIGWESEYEQTMKAFFMDYFDNFYMYRLAQHVYISEKALDDLEIYFNTLRNQSLEWQTEFCKKLQILMDEINRFTNNCRIMFQEKWEKLYMDRIQFGEFEFNSYDMRNKNFEQYVVTVYNNFSMEVHDMLDKMIMDEHQKLQVLLAQYAIKIEYPQFMQDVTADQIDVFKTQGSENIFRLKEVYKMMGLGLKKILPRDVVDETMSVTNKINSNYTDLKKDRENVRKDEVKQLFATMYDFYYGILEQAIRHITVEIKATPKMAELKKYIDNSYKLEQTADKLYETTVKARDALYTEYASKLLWLRQKEAQFVDKKIDYNEDGTLQMNVYAHQCRKEVITNLKYKVVIRER